MGDRLLGKDVIEESEERFVGVIGRILVWCERWRAANATVELGFEGWGRVEVKPEIDLPEEEVGGRIRQADSVLGV